MQIMKKYNFAIMYGLMGYRLRDNPPTSVSVPTADTLRYIQYSIDRWAAYVDIWQIQNEVNASDAWTAAVANYIKSHDPYQHPVTTSWERPAVASIDINAPHWYIHTNPLNADRKGVSSW